MHVLTQTGRSQAKGQGEEGSRVFFFYLKQKSIQAKIYKIHKGSIGQVPVDESIISSEAHSMQTVTLLSAKFTSQTFPRY